MVQGIQNLSLALSRLQGIPEAGTTRIARKIGFTLGTELARTIQAQKTGGRFCIPRLFRGLNLAPVTLREWEPVVFVSSKSKVERLEAAFRGGLLDGVLRERSGRPVFVADSTKLEGPKSVGRPTGNNHPRSRAI